MEYKTGILKPIVAVLGCLTVAQAMAAIPLNMRFAHSMGMQSDIQFKTERQFSDKHRVTHTRMQQYYQGYPVIGGYAIAHQKAAQTAQSHSTSSMNGIAYRGLAADLGTMPHNLEANGQSVLQSFLAAYAHAQIQSSSVIPVIYMDKNHQAHWAYHVRAAIQKDGQRPEQPNAFIDAKTHTVLVSFDAVKTALAKVKGEGFGGNEKLGKLEFNGGGLPYLDMSRDRLRSQCYMENRDVKVVHMHHSWGDSDRTMKFACSDDQEKQAKVWMTGFSGDGYDSENGAYSISNDALYDGMVIKRMYRDWYNQDPLVTPDGKSMKLVMRVHFGRDYENAFWDGQQMTFGDGADWFYPLVSLGVGAHEVSHGFTEQNSNLNYYGHSGGMNESFSDMAAQAAEYYAFGQSSWLIGGEITKPDSGMDALRFMKTPSMDGRSIDSADQYYDGLDVHYSSGVYNRMFYLLANTQGWDTRKAFDVMVLANMAYWTPYSTFEEGACGVISAAEELGDAAYPVQDVKKALAAVSILNESLCALEPQPEPDDSDDDDDGDDLA